MSDRYSKYDAFDIDFPVDRVMRITFNNPKTYNSLDAKGHNQITYIWRDIDLDPDVSAVIVTGAGKAFSSGGDFGMIETNINEETQRIQAWKESILVRAESFCVNDTLGTPRSSGPGSANENS